MSIANTWGGELAGCGVGDLGIGVLGPGGMGDWEIGDQGGLKIATTNQKLNENPSRQSLRREG